MSLSPTSKAFYLSQESLALVCLQSADFEARSSSLGGSFTSSPQILQEFRRRIDACHQQVIARTGTRHVQ